MADISIIQDHELSPVKAKAAAQKAADQMVEDFDMVIEWVDQTLIFKRSGVSGTLTLLDQQAQLDITLGLLLKSFAPKIEEKVTRNMQKVFANNA
jgi:putative polyhydroxyalkanoate system protein